MDIQAQVMEGLVGLPRLGAVVAAGSPVVLFVVVDQAGGGVPPVSAHLPDLVLSIAAPRRAGRTRWICCAARAEASRCPYRLAVR